MKSKDDIRAGLENALKCLENHKDGWSGQTGRKWGTDKLLAAKEAIRYALSSIECKEK